MNTTGKSLLHELDEKYFPRPWTLLQWQEISETNHQIYCWTPNTEISGFALFGLVPGDDTAHLLKICLIPELRGRGEASKFWKTILLDLKNRNVLKVFLEVEETNLRAQSFYKKVGFEVIRRVKDYYTGGETGIMMLLTL